MYAKLTHKLHHKSSREFQYHVKWPSEMIENLLHKVATRFHYLHAVSIQVNLPDYKKPEGNHNLVTDDLRTSDLLHQSEKGH